MHKLIIAPSAEADLNTIVAYIVRTLCNPEAALALVNAIDEVYGELERLPAVFPFCDDPILRDRGYHQVGVNGYVMIYRVENETDIVRIVHFYHATQDYLNKMRIVHFDD